jgi:hypothetical protein
MKKEKFRCGYCSSEFFDYLSNHTKSKNGLLFCSRKCKGAYQTSLAISNSPTKSVSKCVVCGVEKPISEFYKDKSCVANGYVQYSCKQCVQAERIRYYDKNTDDVNKRVRSYQDKKHNRKRTQTGANPAQMLLNHAVKKGIICKPNSCEKCHENKRLHAHHWNGYDHPYDVVWLCPSCHHAAHGRGPKARIEKPA